MNSFKILDCTLRDGGYYTNWNFDSRLVKKLVKALDMSGVDIIELGYKSPVLGGPYRKCNDGFVKSVIDFNVKAELAFMIDAKDFINDNSIDTNLIYDVIHPKHSSLFSICRIAVKDHEISYLSELIDIIQGLGYTVFCNLMSISTTSKQDTELFIHTCNKYNISAVYIADSYGALKPSDVNEICNNKGITGIHTHDNLGLAFANCLQAIQHNVIYVDGTITGMGRGVGNVRTEQLAIYRDGSINTELLEVINEFDKLKLYHGWGYNPIYMLSGLNHIHPLYAQDISQSNLSVASKLKCINELNNTLTYDSQIVSNTISSQRAVVVIPARYKSSRFPGKPLALINNKHMILHVAEKAEIAVGKHNVYIATENEEISRIVKQAGYHVVLTSDNCLTGTDRVAEASREIDADIFVNVQGDEPMIDPNDIVRVIDMKREYPDFIINCAADLNYDEDAYDKKIPKMICDLNNNLIYSSRNVIPGTKNGKGKNIMKQVCIYAFSKHHLEQFYDNVKTPLEYQEDIEIIRCIEKGMKVKIIKIDNISYAVDYPSDIQIIESKI